MMIEILKRLKLSKSSTVLVPIFVFGLIFSISARGQGASGSNSCLALFTTQQASFNSKTMRQFNREDWFAEIHRP